MPLAGRINETLNFFKGFINKLKYCMITFSNRVTLNVTGKCSSLWLWFTVCVVPLTNTHGAQDLNAGYSANIFRI